jgi:hypothetical protein
MPFKLKNELVVIKQYPVPTEKYSSGISAYTKMFGITNNEMAETLAKKELHMCNIQFPYSKDSLGSSAGPTNFRHNIMDDWERLTA